MKLHLAQIGFLAASLVLITADEKTSDSKDVEGGKQQEKRGLYGLGYGHPVAGLGGYGAPHQQPYSAPVLIPGVLYGQDIGYTRSYYTAAHPYNYGHSGYHQQPALPYPAAAPYGHGYGAVPSGYGKYPTSHPEPYSPYTSSYAKYPEVHPTKYEPKGEYSVYGRLDKKHGNNYSYGYKASAYDPYTYRH